MLYKCLVFAGMTLVFDATDVLEACSCYKLYTYKTIMSGLDRLQTQGTGLETINNQSINKRDFYGT